MTVIKPPSEISIFMTVEPMVFLAGSIEMGKAIDWQTEFCKRMSDLPVTILNPRRDDWDSSWEQKITNPKFKEQVEWELTALGIADIVVMYLVPGTMSPISLLELGLKAGGRRLIVCCPEGFWRKGNVDIVCQRFNVQQVETFDELVEEVIRSVKITANQSVKK